jgi:hypothetical protein
VVLTVLASSTVSASTIIMSIPNKNSKKTQTEVKNSVLRACLYEFCFSPLGTTATSIRNQNKKKTNVATTRSTFGRHFNAKVHLENHGLLSLYEIREVLLILSKDVNGNGQHLELLKEKTKKILDQMFATTKQDNIITQ